MPALPCAQPSANHNERPWAELLTRIQLAATEGCLSLVWDDHLKHPKKWSRTWVGDCFVFLVCRLLWRKDFWGLVSPCTGRLFHGFSSALFPQSALPHRGRPYLATWPRARRRPAEIFLIYLAQLEFKRQALKQRMGMVSHVMFCGCDSAKKKKKMKQKQKQEEEARRHSPRIDKTIQDQWTDWWSRQTCWTCKCGTHVRRWKTQREAVSKEIKGSKCFFSFYLMGYFHICCDLHRHVARLGHFLGILINLPRTLSSV